MEARVGLLRGSAFFGDGLELYVNRAEETFELEFHAHDFYEIAYVAEGRGYHHVRDRVIPVSKGDVFLLPIGHPHVFRPSSADRRQKLAVRNCVFSEALLRDAQRHVPELDLRRLFEGEGSKAKDVRLGLEPLFRTMDEEQNVPIPGSKGLRFALFLQLLIRLVRLVGQAGASTEGGPPLQADPIEEALDYIRQHAAENLNLRMLAERSGLSERHFFRLFKARTGQPFLAYVRDLRIRMGCELLLGTKHKIGAVAAMVGYRDTQSFHEAFKRIAGMTPGEYRRTGWEAQRCSK
ncbi:AraC family transcriptional regulator [Cohnella caldifontis]|uniref:AraC family transcriptional regulator n=1 Tax=Cohnella caldifontis TaxID=3027471 RepID=UPI0023ED51F2|nr:AraC family transcriptional regulator [Cohnella sp. YIM B05605]